MVYQYYQVVFDKNFTTAYFIMKQNKMKSKVNTNDDL